MASAALRTMMVGDLVLDEPKADRFFDDARSVLKSTEVLIGHVEVPGLVHQTAKLAMYERPAARAAIDAGGDVVFGRRAEILKDVEVWCDKPILHGLGNFVTITRSLNIEGNDSRARRAGGRQAPRSVRLRAGARSLDGDMI